VGRRKVDRSYSVTNSNGTTNTGTSYTKQYQYNELGNLLQSTNESGIDTYYKYDIFGNKIEEKTELNHTHKWTYDITNNYAFGRLTETRGVGDTGITYYYYNDFGQLDYQSLKDYTYHENGLLKSVTQTYSYTNSYGPDNLIVGTTYHYDILGNRVYEIHSSSRSTAGPGFSNTESGNFKQVMAYDGRNRLSQVQLLAGGYAVQFTGDGILRAMGQMELTYLYDEFGNRRKISATYKNPGDSTNRSYDSWYAYNKEGHILIENGVVATGTPMTIAPNQGVRYTYDAIGQKIGSESSGTGSYVVPLPGPEGGTINYQTYHEATYTYTDLGLLKSMQTERIEAKTGGTSNYAHSVYDSVLVEKGFDLRGFQMTEDSTHERDSTTNGSNVSFTDEQATSYSYHADGRLVNQIITDPDEDDEYVNRTLYTDYDAAGNLLEYQFKDYNANNVLNYTNTYTYTYTTNHGEYKNNGISVSSNLEDYDTGETTIGFDVFGNTAITVVNNGRVGLGGAVQYTTDYMVYNNDGQIVYNHETRTSATDIKNSYIYVNGNTIGNLGQSPSFSPFGKSGMQQATTPSQYVVQGGESLAEISQTIYGNSSYWYLIADANGLNYGAGEEIPLEDAGRSLKIPNIVNNKYNDANTFKPYNPSEIIGDLTPSPVAPPPPSDKSNPFVAILSVVVSMVIAAYMPALLPELQGFMGVVTAVGNAVMRQ
jgi:YD repeat-containing protein